MLRKTHYLVVTTLLLALAAPVAAQRGRTYTRADTLRGSHDRPPAPGGT